jgi:hypothetical protein
MGAGMAATFSIKGNGDSRSQSRRHWRVGAAGIALSVSALTGCATAQYGGGGGDPAPPPTTRDLLGAGRTFALAPDRTTVQVEASVDDGPVQDAARVTLPAVRGTASVRAEGDQVTVDDLAVDLADVELPAEIAPAGTRLTDLHLRLVEPASTADADWSADGDEVGGDAVIGLELDWSIAIGGQTLPLAPQRLVGIELGVMVSPDGSSLALDAGAVAAGTRWSWAGIVSFGDATIALHGNG